MINIFVIPSSLLYLHAALFSFSFVFSSINFHRPLLRKKKKKLKSILIIKIKQKINLQKTKPSLLDNLSLLTISLNEQIIFKRSPAQPFKLPIPELWQYIGCCCLLCCAMFTAPYQKQIVIKVKSISDSMTDVISL